MPTRARVAVFDLLGREVAVLIEGDLPAGRTSFDMGAGGMAPGIYLIRALLESPGGAAQTLVRRLAIVRP
jgi:hypothetical protein